MVLLITPAFILPLPVFAGSGHFSSAYLQHAAVAHAERLMEHRRGCARYDDAVAYTAWKVQKRIKRDLGYKIWAVYNDCTTLYVTYWKLCYLCATISRVIEAVAGSA
ncbi:hypothetical protein GPECTOR_15g415 [Gonium pectorale]|uniref:Uncharacterized protein n=1 Tax=Gonium pectorale TaxID=33097 RepID=A0A150GLR2_GONPE|nr:hypothetical protein GPECTOR_15g415 [Gonium pectorale]|eukprot:KXZ50731.1 hypothetical protein GPECTOR_15g415 [Gonium pectorale]